MPHIFEEIKIDFPPHFYEGFDTVVMLFWQTHLDFIKPYEGEATRSIPDDRDPVIYIYEVEESFLSNFVIFGVKLMNSSMHPWIIEILLTNAREALLLKCKPNERDLLGLQTLWVIRAVMLATLLGVKEIYRYAQNFVSNSPEMTAFMSDMYKNIQSRGL
ncbi:MAG: hypothetical protein FWG65_01925 [Turicibacter sp.]|nr:hypothetical protein [Turicibacter sp.]